MSKFSVDYNSLKRSSEELLNMAKPFYDYQEKILEICRNLPISDSVRPRIISSVNKTRRKIMGYESKYKALGNSLNKISDLYCGTTDSENIIKKYFKYVLNPIYAIGALANVSLTHGNAETNFNVFGKKGSAKAGFSMNKLNSQFEKSRSMSFDSDGKIKDLGMGISAGLSYSMLSGAASTQIGKFGADVKASVGNAAVNGSVNISAFKDGKLRPSINADLSAEVSAIKGQANIKYGDEKYNVHAQAKGELASAKAYAKGGIGFVNYVDKDGNKHSGFGASGEAGAEAYLAKGSISGGFSIFGIKVDATLSGKAGGAGAKIGGSVTTSGVQGEVGVGLGLGAGVKVGVDWSGFDPLEPTKKIYKTINSFARLFK